MSSSSSSQKTEAQIKSEIARLTASINQHKLGNPTQEGAGANSYNSHRRSNAAYAHATRSNTYVNPNYKLATNKYVRPGLQLKANEASGIGTVATSAGETSSEANTSKMDTTSALPTTGAQIVKEVVLGGVAFESSGRSLVRKDLPKSKPTSILTTDQNTNSSTSTLTYVRKAGHLMHQSRVYKPKARRGRGRGRGVNMTLNNSRRPYQARRAATKRKYSDKPCPRFTTTGACSRGLTCMYQHDASKIAICWNFLQGTCSKTAETCNLSHDPTPERTPLCLHFLNQGRCNRVGCPFPHVNVGTRTGVCRDFAVLGYCARGLECDKQHVRECPDFAERGECTTKGCKLPHVIRANRTRKVVPTAVTGGQEKETQASIPPSRQAAVGTDDAGTKNGAVSAAGAEIGDEYISLTFNESESSDEESEENENEEEEGDDSEDDREEDVGGDDDEGGDDEEPEY